jgi:hypothetical protein
MICCPTRRWLCAIILLAVAVPCAYAARAAELQAGVHGLATRAPRDMKIDGDPREFNEAFATPVGYFDPDLENRAAQFFYMWDDTAFYAALRTLDKKQADPAPDDRLWEGDAVEWYFDTRRNQDFRAAQWGSGAVHMYWTAYKGNEVQPRWCLRPDMLQAIPGTGVEVAARRTSDGAEVEFKLPWANFPEFKVEPNAVIALDAELCYSDGQARVNRTFVYGSPLSVQQPASQARVQLVEKLEKEHWKACGPGLCSADTRTSTVGFCSCSRSTVTSIASNRSKRRASFSTFAVIFSRVTSLKWPCLAEMLTCTRARSFS